MIAMHNQIGKNPHYTLYPDDLLRTLVSCGGYYTCPVHDGTFLGPLVGYAGEYQEEGGVLKKYVGTEYFNFSQADQWPEVLEEFAVEVLEKVEELIDGDLELAIIGTPMAGIKYSYEVARMLNCRHFFLEKEVMQATAFTGTPSTSLALSRYQLAEKQRVIIGEEVVNNFSTTAKVINLVRAQGAEVIGILCAINRSYPFREEYEGIPIISALELPTKQYRQNDPFVAAQIESDNIIWKPKLDDWPRLLKAMHDAEKMVRTGN